MRLRNRSAARRDPRQSVSQSTVRCGSLVGTLGSSLQGESGSQTQNPDIPARGPLTLGSHGHRYIVAATSHFPAQLLACSAECRAEAQSRTPAGTTSYSLFERSYATAPFNVFIKSEDRLLV